jgi:hypothetical protein
MSHGIAICDSPMRSGPFVLRTRGNDRSHREIVNPVDEVSMLNEIAKRDFPISQEIAGPTEGSTVDRWHRVSGYREIRGQGVHAL